MDQDPHMTVFSSSAWHPLIRAKPVDSVVLARAHNFFELQLTCIFFFIGIWKLSSLIIYGAPYSEQANLARRVRCGAGPGWE